MLDQISTLSETQFKRQVNPSVEGHMRAESRHEFESKQAERVSTREALRADRADKANARSNQQHSNEIRQQQTLRDRGQTAAFEANQGPSRAAELAEKLAKHVKEARQEDAREFRHAGFSHSNKSRQISQTYQQDLPISQNRIIDEIA